MSTIEKHDMTQGKILLPLVSFTIPLVLGNLFQLTYNAADSVIVGKYVGEQALAAVGTSTPIMNIAILLNRNTRQEQSSTLHGKWHRMLIKKSCKVSSIRLMSIPPSMTCKRSKPDS